MSEIIHDTPAPTPTASAKQAFNRVLAQFTAEHPDVKIMAIVIAPGERAEISSSHQTTALEISCVFAQVSADLQAQQIEANQRRLVKA